MKLFMYGVQAHEKEIIRAWADAHAIDIETTADFLSEKTVDRAKGYDGICIQQPVPLGAAKLYAALKSYGIKQIATRTAGYDMIDLQEAERNELIVTNVPAYSPYAVAELAVTQAMQLVRHVSQFQKRIADNDFRWDGLMSREIRSMTVGIVGTGRIGVTAAQLFKGLGAKIIGFDQYPNDRLKDLIEYRSSLEEVLKEADIVSLHTPLFDSTRHMINARTLKLMKKSAYLINIARGALIDTEALIDALESGEIAGAALDTFENETVINKKLSGQSLNDPLLEKLIAMDQVLLTPHVGFFTETAIRNIVDGALNSVLEVLQTGTSKNRVKPAVTQ
ncbi:D-2-hydroxyacid dehydrogenase [Sporolactobacillus terrae]|uniref:Lactate dehydrogenase n=1 Tax=Sporolactobacillus terrae TaxID=269673 RepID=A0ABX5QA01_9BACL|nr:D-2-hydroxyacid dehydrogenase [Sporolactobacillus terrae]QAA23460.1 lactate dehydrogenase [Sporolactobacillus terrae]QAA26430.1 lactate dehydrogenase [Sporolactobacillus terrae]UAK15524.1 D-2-hydroxyacid dehydrogenase [Sporolactobacillus terrae]